MPRDPSLGANDDLRPTFGQDAEGCSPSRASLHDAAPATRQPPPNLIYILCDDLGYGDIRALNPDGKIATPHVDRLAAEGMVFRNATPALEFASSLVFFLTPLAIRP